MGGEDRGSPPPVSSLARGEEGGVGISYIPTTLILAPMRGVGQVWVAQAVLLVQRWISRMS
jgi:hypothetical protein